VVIHKVIHGLIKANRGYPLGYPRTHQSQPWLSIRLSTDSSKPTADIRFYQH